MKRPLDTTEMRPGPDDARGPGPNGVVAEGREMHAPGNPVPVAALTRITLRPIGSPLPLGFAALGAGSVLLTGLQLHWLPGTAGHQVAIALLAFVVPAQSLASIFGFLGRDSVGGTGMGILAGTWLATGSVMLASPPGTRSPTLGLLTLYVAAVLLVPVVAAFTGKIVAGLVMLMGAVRFAMSGIYNMDGARGWETTSGWFGLAVMLIALYGALAFEVEDTQHRTILPTLRRGAGWHAINGGVTSDIATVGHEAGVREQL